MDWKILAVLTPLLFVTYQSVSKFFPKDAPIFLINAIASLTGAIIMFILHKLTSGNGANLDAKILPLVILIGILIATGNFLIIKSYSLGAPQSGFTSIFYPLLILYGFVFGLLFWHEKMNLYQVAGMILSFIGVLLMTYFKK